MSDQAYGGFWRRLLAYVIDEIILYLASLILLLIGAVALALGGVPFTDIVTTGDLPDGMGVFVAIYAVMTFLTGMAYFTWFHGAVGQTPGKMLLAVRVVQITGEPMTFGVAFLRWVGSLVSGLVLWLGFLWIAFDPRNQGWHDKIAATLVVRIGNEPETEAHALSAAPADSGVDYPLTENGSFPADTGHGPEDKAGDTRPDPSAHLP